MVSLARERRAVEKLACLDDGGKLGSRRERSRSLLSDDGSLARGREGGALEGLGVGGVS